MKVLMTTTEVSLFMLIAVLPRRKLKAARDRKRATGSKVEGRKSYAEIDVRDNGGQMIVLAKRLRRKTPKRGRRSLRMISVELEKAGFVSQSGKPYAATAVARMLGEIT